MRVFVYEHTCALAADLIAESLHAEGRAMLSAVLDDFSRLSGVETVPFPTGAGRETFFNLARSANYSLVIAPEFDGILTERCRWVEEAGGRLLGSSSAAVRLTADKLRTAHHLRSAGVPTPDCASFPGSVAFPAVLKPRDGAGSQATFLVRSEEELTLRAEQAVREGWRGEFIVQTFAPGLAASVAFLLGPARCVPLMPTAQNLSDDGRFRYLGGQVPLPVGLRERAVSLARRAVETVAGLTGYVGVDVVLGETDQVIEINPRLTTSYVGLRALAETNLAEAMLRVAAGEEVVPRWCKGVVRFGADGTL